MWIGSAAVCLNEKREVLMVLQGKSYEEKKWSVPSGELEEGESPEDCCIRETREETGYRVRILKKLHVKEGWSYGRRVQVHYFLAEVTGGKPDIQDPDGLIHAIGWKNREEIRRLNLSFPEDRPFLLQVLGGYLDSPDRLSNGGNV